MLWIAKIAGWLVGPAALPLAIAGALILGGNLLAARREALIQQGADKCEAKWEAEVMKVQRDAAIADARAMKAQLNATDVLNMELKNNAADLQKELELVRRASAEAAAGLSDDAQRRCISDGVRDMARGVQSLGGGEVGPGSKGGKRR